jgi:hypothetical protein
VFVIPKSWLVFFYLQTLERFGLSKNYDMSGF